MPLRLLHTSDWHLGRALHEEPLLEDQAWALDRLVELVREERPDAVVVAGDVYDRAVPPPEAVALLDDVLTRLADLGVPVVATAGNHDSAERLSFGARLLATRGVHLRGALARAAEPVLVPGKGLIYAVPFIDPDQVRGLLQDDAIRGHAAATARLLDRVRAHAAARTLPAVLVAHCFVQGGRESPDSERPLVVGSAGSVPAEALAGFDYVALGHLHAPQEVAPGVRYSGSLLKYSFAEADHRKGAVLVEVDRGRATAREVPLGARRDLVRLRGTLRELLGDARLAAHERDLVEVELLDPGYVLEARHQLRARFPGLLNLHRAELAAAPGAGAFGQQVAQAGRDDDRLFRAFFETVTGAAPGEEEQRAFAACLEALDREERGR